MTKIEIPTEIAEETAQRNGAGQPPRAGKGKDRGKRLDSLVDGVARNLFEALSEAKRRQDYGLFYRLPTGSSRSPSWRPAGWRSWAMHKQTKQRRHDV
jgi:hypothetical protein